MITTVVAALALSIGVAPPTSEPQPVPEGFVPVVDDTRTIVVAVPETWTDVNTVALVNDDGTPRPYIAVSPDIDSFLATFDTPGVLYMALPFELNPVVVVESYGLTSGCETIEVKTYDDPMFVGVIQIGTNCGPLGMTWNMVVASNADHTFTAVVQVQTVVEDQAREIVLLTFNTLEAATLPG